MTCASLFSGIGGFDLAAEWMGWETLLQCEINPFAQKVLKYYWPNAELFTDITKTDFTKYEGLIDILTGGFPCQPYSVAGKQQGKDDERHLWPHMLRAVREIKPRWVVGENVRGLVSWSGGLVFDEAQSDLEAEGYSVVPFLLPACAVNAPHKRERIWFVAYSASELQQRDEPGKRGIARRENVQQEHGITNTEFPRAVGENGPSTNTCGGRFWEQQSREPNEQLAQELERRNVTDTDSARLQTSGTEQQATGTQQYGELHSDAADTSCTGQQKFDVPALAARAGLGTGAHYADGNAWQNFPTEPPLRLRDDGLSEKLAYLVVNEFYGSISEENRIKDLLEVWDRVSQEEVWEQVRGLYSLESKTVLFQTMQLYQTGNIGEIELSPFSEDFSKPILQHLRKYKQFGSSPQGRKLQKQRTKQFADTLSFLPHEVALAARRFETAIAKFEAWHRNESIKGYGNAIVPQVVLQIFDAIEMYDALY